MFGKFVLDSRVRNGLDSCVGGCLQPEGVPVFVFLIKWESVPKYLTRDICKLISIPLLHLLTFY